MKYLTRSFHKAFGFLALAFGTLFLPSCAEEFLSDDQVDDGIEMVINVGTDTRTTNDGDHTLWEEDDVLTVIHAPEDGNDYWASPFNKTGDNAFSGKVRRLSSSNDWYVVYPYKEENLAADQISLTFPASQTQTGNENMLHIAGEQFPLWGKVKGLPRGQTLNVQMQNLLAVAGFKVENDLVDSDRSIIVKEVQFTATTPVSGAFSLDLTGSDPVLTAGSGATKTVKLAVTNGSAIAKGANSWFYMAVAPFEAAAGSKLQLKTVAVYADDPDTEVVFYRTIDLTAATSFNSGVIKTVNVPFDEKHTTNPDAGSGTEVELPVGGEPENGVYLLVYENGANSMAFAAFDEYKSQHYAIPVVVADGVVLPQDGIDLSRFEVELENTGTEHPNDAGHDAYNVRNSEGKYVFYATANGTYEAEDALHILDNNEMDIQGTTYQYYHTFTQTEDGVRIVCSINTGGHFYLLSYTSANGFNYQQDNASGTNLHLYRLGGSAKEHQELTFSADNVTYNFDTNGEGPLINAPTLSGDKTPVTWSSNNVSVATVDNSGHVTIHGVGIAVITAKAEADQTYYSDSASYTIEVTSSSMQTWYKAEEMEDGKQYLIVSNGYALQNNNGSVAATAVTVSNETITLNAPSGLLWTANSSKQLTNNSQYLGSSSSSSGGGFPGSGWGGLPSLSIGSQSSALVWTYVAESNHLTYSVSSGWGGATAYYLYYSNSSNAFTINTESDTHIAALYSTTKPADKQFLSFANATVNKILGESCQIGDTFNVQEVTGAITTVTYTSSKPSVATINGKVITVVGKGSTTITATAAEENGFKSATASYTLRISEPAPAGFEALGTFNLENAALMQYLDDASVKYPADDKSTIANNTYASTSVISSYANWSSPSRKDIPAPVVLSWDVASTGTATVTVYNDQELQDEVWTWTASEGSKSFDVYNLIPGLTYYCTVVDDNNGNYLLKGTFNTEGRRRMIKVSDTVNANNANNCRDLGGLKTTDGRRIKYGLIFRGTNMTSTTREEKRIIAEFMNVGLDNDLRSGTGGGMNRDNPFENTNYTVRYIGPGYGSVSDLQNVSNYKKTIQAFLDAAKPGTQNYQKASYFHCYIGADRTGYTGLMIEGLLGVSLTDCTIDYELTTFSTAAGSRPRNGGQLCYIKDAVTFLNKAENGGTGTSLQEKITYYFINKLGISEADIENFKNWALEPDPEAN